MVFRVVLGLLTVLVFAAPAFAQNLAGTWRFRSVAGIQDRGTICAAGSVTFNAAGAVIAPSTLQECNPAVPARPLVGGSLVVGANSSVSGSVDIFDLQGTFLPAGDAFVAVSTVSPDGAVGFGLAVFVKDTTTTFAQGDLAGTWRVHLIDGGEPPSPITEQAFGSIVIGPTGAITGGTLTVLSAEEGAGSRQVTGGTATINTDGVITGTVLTVRVPGNTSVTTAFNGLMATDKKLVAGSLRVVDGEEVENGLALLQRQPPSSFATGDIAGQWTLNHAILDGSSSDQATWLRGTVDVNAQGVASGTLLDPSGTPFSAVGAFAVDAAGLVSGELVTSDPILAFVIQGTMFDTKSHIIGSDIIVDAGEPGSPVGAFGVGLLSMVRRGAAPSIVQFSQPTYTVKENVPNAAITVTRTGTLAGTATVIYTATALTAVANVDFKPVSGVLTFPANVGIKSFNVPILNNTVVDGNRSVTLTLGAPTNAALGAPSVATLIIQDDDLPGTFKVDKGTYTVLESAGTLAIIVRRTGTSLAGNVSVGYATFDGTARSEPTPGDYTATSGRLTFNAGEVMKTVSIPILKDNLVDGDKTFTFVLSDPSSGATLDQDLSSALVTIKDVDVGGQIKFAPATYSVGEGAGLVKLTVVRTGGTAGGVLVDFATVNGTAVGGEEGSGDFDVSSGTLSFGTGNTSATITIRINQDTLAEGNETFQVQLLNARGGATLVPPSVATVTIVDDESALQFSAPTFTVTEGTASAVITVLRTGPLVGQATVSYTATPGTAVVGRDFTQVSGVLTFPANTPSKTFNVPILNNTLLDGNRSVMLGLNAPTGGVQPGGVQLGTVNTAVLTIVDNEQAGQFKLDKGAYTVLETAGFVTIVVMRTGTNLVGNVSVTLTSTNGSATSGVNYTAPAGALTFAAGETTKIVKIPITPDHVVTGPLTFNVALANPSSGALGTPATAPVTITNTDVGGQIKFAPATYLVAESTGSATLVVQRTGGLAGNVSVGFTTALIVPASASTASSDDFTAVTGRLTFGFGDTSATIVIPITRDEVTEPRESFQVRLFDAQGGATLPGPSVATVTIGDDLDSVVQFSGLFSGNFPQVVRTGSLALEATVDFLATDGTALVGIDYLPLSGTLTFKPNVAVQYIPLTIITDNIAEGPETFTIALRNPRAPARLGPDSVRTFVIADNDFGGNVGFEAALYTATEGGTVDVAITRTGGLGAVLTVHWQAGSGSATPGVDFTPASGDVTFGPSDTRKTFTISALTDALAEGPETVPLNLSVPAGAATLGRATTTLRILDAAPVLQADLAVTNIVNVASPTVGSNVTFTITATNLGPAAATGVQVTDLLPTGYTFVSATPSQGTYVSTTGVWTVGALTASGAGNSATLSITATVKATGVFNNAATISATGVVDPNTANNTATAGVTPTLQADIAIAKTVSNASPIAGANITFTITATNLGPAAATGVQVTDLLPTGYTFVSATPSQGTYVSTTGLWTVGALAASGAGNSATLSITATVKATGVFNNTATRTASTPTDPNAENNTATAGVTPTLQADIAIAKTVSNAAPLAGTNITFTITATNLGPAAGTGVQVTDLLPTGYTFVSATPSQGTYVSTTGVWTVGALTASGAGNSATLQITATVNATGVFNNTATRTASTPTDPNAANDTATAGVTPTLQADIAIAKIVSNAAPLAGTNITFTITATNLGPAAATGVQVTDLLPTGYTFVSATPSQGTYVSTTGVWTVGALAASGAGNSATLSITATVKATGVFNNTATRTASTPTDPNAENNTATAGVTPTLQADIAIAKTVSNAAPLAGTNITFTITATNLGPAAATGVQVTDLLPTGYTFVSATPSQGTYVSTTGVWTVGALAASGAGNSATLSITATVKATGVFNNTATRTASTPTDPNAANDTATAGVTPTLQADIAIAKTVSNAAPLAGTNITFTITATNLGPAAATGVQVTDLLPTGYTFVSATPSQGTYVSTTGVWTVGALAASGAGNSATLSITATVKATGVFNNTATRTASTPTDPNAANDTATVTVSPVTGLSLSTIGPLVGVGRTITGSVTLPSVAPAGGVNVTLATNPAGIATVAPTTVTINAGATTGAFTVTGVTPGGTTITGTATGFAPGSVGVTVTNSVISLGALPTLGLGQTLSLPFSLSTPAPAGGVTVSFNSANTNIASVTPSVFVPQGLQVAATNPQVTGVNIGSTQISASAIGFAPDTRSANVSVVVSFTPATFSVVVGTSSNITVNISAAAPSGGLTFNLTTANQSIATVVSAVTVPAGQLSVPVAVTGVTAGQSTTLQANGSGVTSGSATINVTPPPPINLVAQTVGQNLQIATSLSLGAAAPAGGLAVTLTSQDATRLVLSNSQTAAGSGQIVVTVAAGSSSSPAFYYQALASTGTVNLTATATGYASGQATITLNPSGFIINSPGSFTTTTLSTNTSVQITSARLNPANLNFAANQELRGGLTQVNVSVTATDQTGGPGVGTISPVVFNGGDLVKATPFDPAAAGTSLIAVVPPAGFSTPANFRTITATVTAPLLTVFPQTVGRDLQVATSVGLGAPAPTGGLQITLTSADPTRLLLSNSQTVAGSGQITLTVGAGSSGSPAFYLQALDSTGPVTVTATAPAFGAGQASIPLTPSGFIINSPSAINTTTLAANVGFQITSARLAPTTLQFQANQELRAGLSPVTVSLTATDQTGGPGVGTIVPTSVVFNATDLVKTPAFDPAAAGTSLIAVVPPAGFSTPANFRTIIATVTAPVITLANQTIGQNLQVFVSLGLGAPAPTGGQQVTVTSSDARKLVLSSSQTAAGADQLVITVPQGASSSSGFYMQALDSTGPVTVTATAPGFVSALATITLTPSGFIINSPGAINTTTFSGVTSVQITSARLAPTTLQFQANQELRGGIAPVSVTVTATDQTGGPRVGTIVTSPLVFNGGDVAKSTSFDPASAGTSQIQVVPPAGFSTPATFRTILATVTAPPLNFSVGNVLVGRDLQELVSVTLGATPPSPVTVTVTVASTAIATITTNGAVAGGDTITFTNVTSTVAGSFFVQGRAATGLTNITAQASGYADIVGTVSARPSGFIINSPGNFTTTAGAANSNIQITSARLNATTLNFEQNQAVRGGATVSVTVTATSPPGAPSAGTITTSPLTFNGNVVAVTTQFDPAGSGTSQIAVGVPTGFDTPSNFRQVTVTVNP